MVAKSVIEIDVNDESFKRFQKAFNEYQKILDEQAKKWAEVDKIFDKISRKQKDFNKNISDGNKALKDAAYVTAGIAKNMASAALSAAKWVAFGALGGGFGLGALASSASDYRRQALGLGVSTGQLRASSTAYGRAFDAEGVLSNIANLQNDPVGQATLARLGASKGGNPAEQAGEVYKSAVQLFKQFGQNPVFAKNLGLTDVFSLEELRRGANMSAKELNEMAEQFQKDKKAFELDDKVSKAWQDFWYQLKRSGNVLELSFIKNLSVLTPQLSKLTESVTAAVDSFLGSDKVKQALDDFATYLASPTFQKDLQTFFTAVKRLGEATYSAAVFLGLIDKNNQVTDKEIEDKQKELPWYVPKFIAKGAAQDEKERQNQVLGFLQAKGFTKDQAAGFAGNLKAESGYDPSAIGDGGKAYGIAQWHPDRQAIFKELYGKNIVGSSLQEQLEFLNWELTSNDPRNKLNKNAGDQLRKAGSIDSAVKAGLAFERPSEANYSKNLSQRTDYANNIVVTINNNTGNNAIATATALQK